jgi:putative transposase
MCQILSLKGSKGNGCAGPFIRTLEEDLLWVRYFATVAELSEALREFGRRYNREWLIERHGFETPSQARSDFCGRSKGLESDRQCRKVE